MKGHPDEEAFLRALGALAREESAAARALEAELEPTSACVERAFGALAQSFAKEQLRSRCWLRLQRSSYVAPVLLSAAATWLLHKNIWGPGQRPFAGEQRTGEVAANPRTTYTLSLADAVLTEPSAQPVLCAGSTVSLLLRPTQPTLVPPRAHLDFDDGRSSFACEAEAHVEVDGSIALRLTLPSSAGRLRISLDAADSAPLAAVAAHTRGGQQWELPVSLDAPAPASASHVKLARKPYALTAD
jgi:hypothetical protein